MKTKTLFAALAGLFTTLTYGQTSSFYRPIGSGFDHGIGREVIESLTPNEFVIVGTSYQPITVGARPIVTVSKYGAFGAPLWANIYPINIGAPVTTADGMSIAANPTTNEYAVLAYVASIAPALSQSVLIRLDAAGNYLGHTELGPLRATSVVFDPFSSNYAVLGQVNSTISGTLDLQLTIVNGLGGVLNTYEYDSNTGSAIDSPARMCINPTSGNYTLVGTTNNGSNDDLFIVHTLNGGAALISSDTYDALSGNEVGVDVAVSATTNSEVIVGYQSPNFSPFLIEINDLTGVAGSMTTLISAPVNNKPTAIAMDPTTGNYFICGEESSVAGNTNGFLAITDNNLNALSYVTYGQPPFPGNEDLTDITYSQTTPTVGQLVMTGEHQLQSSWPFFPTPAGEYFNWLVMTDVWGMGTCPVPFPLGVAPIGLSPTPNTNMVINPLITMTVFMGRRPITQAVLDECSTPFRLAPQEEETTTNISVFPNPASTQLTLSNPSESSVVFEMTNALGDLVMRETVAAQQENFQLDVSNIAPGIYFYQVMNGADVLSKEKIIIAR